MRRDPDWFDGLFAAVTAKLDRRAAWWIAALFAGVTLVLFGEASQEPFPSYDIVTLLTASLPTWGGVWRFFADGLDTTGPVQSLVARIGLELPLPPEIALRLPFMAAYLGMCLGLYGFVRRRYAAGYALAAAMLPMTFPPVFGLMITARSYPLMLTAASLAIWFWQAAAEGNARPWTVAGLWLMLAFAMAAHFFSVFLFVPFAAAQLALDWPKRRPDWAVWLALLLFPAGYLPFLRGARNAHANYARTFFSKVNSGSVLIPYRIIYLSGAWIAISVLLLVAVWLLWRQKKRSAEEAVADQERSPGFTRAEWVLLVVLVTLPIYVVLGAIVLGAFREDYAKSFTLGLILMAVAGFAEVAGRGARAGALAFAAVLACAASPHHLRSAIGGVSALLHPSRIHSNLTVEVLGYPDSQYILNSDLPVAEGASPNPLDYYGYERLRDRIYTLTDRAIYSDPKFSWGDTSQDNVRYFSHILPIPLQPIELDDFVAQHPHFLVPTGLTGQEWLTAYLIDRQQTKGDVSVRIVLLHPSFDGRGGSLLDVQMKR